MRHMVRTSSKELYDKFSLFNLSDKVVIENVTPFAMTKILNNINAKKQNVNSERVGNYFILKKNGNINFDVFLIKK